MHLIFLIHGLFGNPNHMQSMAESLEEAFDSNEVTVHRASCMTAVGTFDGVVANARLLFEELKLKLKETSATQLSIVGYSMGGICARYLIGLLQETRILDRVEPLVFATFAAPHLGTNFPERTWFGQVFDFIGSKVVAFSGRDLFNCNSLLTDLADPQQKYYQGLQRFSHLLLFANMMNDRTVPFWTAYLTPVDPFRRRSHVDLRLHSNKIMVDMKTSKWHDQAVHHEPFTFREFRNKALVWTAFPIFLSVLLTVMGILTISVYVKRWYRMMFGPRPNIKNSGERPTVGDELMGDVGDAMDEALEFTSNQRRHSASRNTPSRSTSESPTKADPPASYEYAYRSPGFAGLIDECTFRLDLTPQTRKNMDNLNQLPWMKHVVRMTAMNSHGTIINRRGGSSEGKKMMELFARTVTQLSTSDAQ